ncbi:hypothetical protein OIU85_025772 [Salix viminalis]|uniref:Uncharacterized protein n=1 Tax=Salix viminalis TaxID=40686 RepID=A0A9Q0TMC0_SALVM|nr:hypothetical protein OIU85_025772 [Salix viminalis]
MNPLMQKDCQRKSWAALLSLVGREIRRSKLRKLGIQRTMTMETKHEEMAHDEKYAGYAPETADETGKYYDVDGASYKSDSYDEVKFSAEIHTSVSLPPSYITGSSGQSDASLCFSRDAFSILFIHRVEPKHPILWGID